MSPEGVSLNELGKTVQSFWMEIPSHFANVKIDEFVVMPNHLHGIIRIDSMVRTCPDRTLEKTFPDPIYLPPFPDLKDEPLKLLPNFFQTDPVAPDPMRSRGIYYQNHFGAQPKGSLGIIIGQFKAAVTRWAKVNGQGGIFDWLPRYNDRIVRNEKELIAIRQYIRNNPGKWWEKYGNEVLL